MGLFSNRKNGGMIADAIRCDEPSYLIWKWHPAGGQAGNNRRENAIRLGSSLRVKDGEVAVFVYKQKNGTMQDFIEGPFDQTLKTANLPVLSGLLGLAFDGNSPFQAEVYFINYAKIIQVKFGVPFFDIYDPRFSDFGVPVAVRGTVSFHIADYREFIKLHRLDSFTLEDFQAQIRDAVCRYVKDVVAGAPAAHNIPVVQIESKISTINDAMEFTLGERLKEAFGVILTGADISAIEIDKSGDGYRQLMAVTKDVATATVQAQTAANLENYAETMRIRREEGQYAQHKQTQNDFIGAFRVEKQAEVGIAGANALGHMGENGAGSVGGAGEGAGGFNPAAFATSMAMGTVIAQNVAGTMRETMNSAQEQITPPPIPKEQYSVAVNGQPTGPYDIGVLKQMAQSGQLTGQTLVWKPGMKNWESAENLASLADVIAAIPPKID